MPNDLLRHFLGLTDQQRAVRASLRIEARVPAGDYPVEVGVYEPRSGDRLTLANGDNRVILATRLRVQ